jgi:hypothetical protein
VARFSVQAWKLVPGYAGANAVTAAPEMLSAQPDGTHTFSISQVDTLEYSRVALIITRIDAEETVEPFGEYRLEISGS